MKRQLMSIMAIGIAALFLGAGTFSYYSDTEESTGNVFQSGTIDLILGGDIPWAFYDIKPCENLSSVIVEFWNIGDFDGYLYNKITYVNKDKTPNPTALTADEFAALIYIEAVTYQHYTYWEGTGWGWGGIHDDLPNWLSMDTNDDGNVSLYEIKEIGWLPYNASDPEQPLIRLDRGKWNITFHMADSLLNHVWGTGNPDEALEFDVPDNGPQADGIKLTWTAVLKQTPGSP